MKKSIYLLAIALQLVACSDFLEVAPKGVLSED